MGEHPPHLSGTHASWGPPKADCSTAVVALFMRDFFRVTSVHATKKLSCVNIEMTLKKHPVYAGLKDLLEQPV